ncbi:MAG: hypothetical protein ACE14S_08495 [Candidatus Bathyarchaeia archaeon]
MQNDLIGEAIATLTELKRVHQLNLELLEQLSVACDWLMSNNIPVSNASTFASLLEKSVALLNEIQAESPKIIQYTKLSDGRKHPNKSDGEVTEPCNEFLIGSKYG